MTDRFVLTDSAIRAALAPPASVRAPFDLAASIRSEVDATPQRRPSLLGRLIQPVDRPVRLIAVAAAIALLALIALLIASGRQSPQILDEAMFRGDSGRTGVVAGPGPATTASIAWDKGVGGPVIQNMPAIVDGVVYVADGSGVVTTFAATDGEQGWSTNLGSPANTSPAVASGLVIVGDNAGDVVALDTNDGNQRWIAHTGGAVVSSPAIVDGVVYVGSADGYLYAIGLDGRQRWATQVGGAITRSPAVVGGRVFIGADGGRFVALDTTGNVIWRRTLDTGQMATPAARDGVVLATSGLGVAAAPHVLYGLDADTGTPLWQWQAASVSELYVGAFDSGLAVIISADHNVYALDIHAGSIPPTLRWPPFRTGGPVGNGAAIAGGVVYIAGGDRTVYAINERTGKEIWHQSVSGQPGAVGVVGDRLYVATDLGRVIAIGP